MKVDWVEVRYVMWRTLKVLFIIIEVTIAVSMLIARSVLKGMFGK